MTDLQTGGCLCNAIRYEFRSEPIAAVHCHCTDCQRVTGSGFATVFGIVSDDITLSGKEHLGYYTLTVPSGQTVTREFCRHCGSALFTEADNNPGYLWIKAGSLDQSDWLKPTAACWTGSAQPWAPADAQIEQFEGNP